MQGKSHAYVPWEYLWWETPDTSPAIHRDWLWNWTFRSLITWMLFLYPSNMCVYLYISIINSFLYHWISTAGRDNVSGSGSFPVTMMIQLTTPTQPLVESVCHRAGIETPTTQYDMALTCAMRTVELIRQFGFPSLVLHCRLVAGSQCVSCWCPCPVESNQDVQPQFSC